MKFPHCVTATLDFEPWHIQVVYDAPELCNLHTVKYLPKFVSFIYEYRAPKVKGDAGSFGDYDKNSRPASNSHSFLIPFVSSGTRTTTNTDSREAKT